MSDFPTQVGPGTDALLVAGFLTAEQRAGIVCHDAARILRLPPAPCRP